jgi:hypothetical protein
MVEDLSSIFRCRGVKFFSRMTAHHLACRIYGRCCWAKKAGNQSFGRRELVIRQSLEVRDKVASRMEAVMGLVVSRTGSSFPVALVRRRDWVLQGSQWFERNLYGSYHAAFLRG